MESTLEIVEREAAPTTGFWRRGTIATNSAWSAGEPLYWFCSVSGEPGTWVAVYTTQPENAEATITVGVGAKNGATVTAAEKDTAVHRTTLTLAATPITVTDALAYAGLKLYDFPAGRILVLGCTASIQWAVTSARVSTINDDAALDWALGTATASNVTLATTMVDLLPKQDKTLEADAAELNTASTGALAASAQFDGTGTEIDMFLNVSFPTTTDIDADGTLTATGTITVTWVNLGDY